MWQVQYNIVVIFPLAALRWILYVTILFYFKIFIVYCQLITFCIPLRKLCYRHFWNIKVQHLLSLKQVPTAVALKTKLLLNSNKRTHVHCTNPFKERWMWAITLQATIYTGTSVNYKIQSKLTLCLRRH